MKYTTLIFFLLIGKFIYSQWEPIQILSHLYRNESSPFIHESHSLQGQWVHAIRDKKTGKTSNNYLDIEPFGNSFIGFTKTGIDLVDTNLDVITSIPLSDKFEIEMLDSRRFSFNDVWYYCATQDFYYPEYYDESFVNRLFCTAVITRYNQPSKRQVKKGLKVTSYKQLLQLKSGKTSHANYLDVYRIVSEKEVYYWALKDTSGQNQVFDVYNEQLECLRSSQITSPEKFHEFHSLAHYYEYEQDESYSIPRQKLLFLEDQKGKLAALHQDGTRLTDFIWDRKVTYEGMKKDSTPVFLFCAKDTSGVGRLMDNNGEPLFGEEYATPSYSPLGNQKLYYVNKKHPEIKILSENFEILIDSVQHFYYSDHSFLNEESQSSNIYIDKTNRLFIHTVQGISPLYPSFFKEPALKNRVSRSVPLFVDEQGYLISDGKTIIRPYE